MPENLEQHQAEVLALRRELFLAEVAQVEVEYQVGRAHRFDDVEQLLDELRG